jgi:hypothetical protein
MGRVVRPIKDHAATLEQILKDPDFSHVYFDLSWDEVAKYVVSNREATRVTADLLNKFPDRFLFGTDEVAPTNQARYIAVFQQYEPLWKILDPETSRKVRLTNYERIFDEARQKVRAWESTHLREHTAE